VTELVINSPHLQTPGQRLSTALLSLSGWLLWSYCLLPLLILCGWWLGIHVCAFLINLCGGYQGLQKLMTLYVCTVAGSALGWAAWIGYDRVRGRDAPDKAQDRAAVTLPDLSHHFNLPEALLETCRHHRITTVEFDANGQIIALIPLAD
jgi:poly-beta-1,6-N-acetyl-D-glucosamine biosynthesis protein PgaD